MNRPVAAPGASAYRCAECGHGRHLTAWGNASVCGPLGADGEITEYEWDELWQLHEDSIQCARHPGAAWEKLVAGRYCRWYCCTRCDGDGRGGQCPCTGVHPADGDGKRTAHSGWWQGEPWPSSDLDRDGHAFTPGRDPHCRYCGAFADGESGCKGDTHECPATVEPGTGKPSFQLYRSDIWVCYQPGTMNGDFTEWRCEAGHVVTRETEVPRGFPGRNPQEHLAHAAAGQLGRRMGSLAN